MKRKLGLFGTLICSAGLLALPAAAQYRGNGNYNNYNGGQQYGGYSQGYGQQYNGGRQYGGYQQGYTQQYNGGYANGGAYGQGYGAYGQGYGRGSGYGQAYSGYSNYGYEHGRNHWRGDEHEGRRERHYRRDDRWGDWD